MENLILLGMSPKHPVGAGDLVIRENLSQHLGILGILAVSTFDYQTGAGQTAGTCVNNQRRTRSLAVARRVDQSLSWKCSRLINHIDLKDGQLAGILP